MRIIDLPMALAGAIALFGLAITPAYAADPQPVLMVIANQDFNHQEYTETRSSLEAQGLDVVVAASTTDVATPHSGGTRSSVSPDLALVDVLADDYSTVVFVGGWGMSSYQYGFEGTYQNVAYRRDSKVIDAVNHLINEFVQQDKYLAAIGHGVSVLAYARVDGSSPVAGKTVTSWAGYAPSFERDGEVYPDATVTTRWHIESNGGYMPLTASAGDPQTVEDDVYIDGNIITAENYDSAYLFGQVIASLVPAR